MIQQDIEPDTGLLDRPRLLALIETPQLALVTTIIAGAGFGKTTLAMQWARQARIPVRWRPLQREDNDPRVLLHRLVSGLAGERDTADAVPGRDDCERRAWARLDELGRSGAAGCLIIDDLHHVTNPACYDLLDRLIARLPVTHPIMLLSRKRLPLRLGKLRALGDVREIDADHLRFTRDEVIAVIGAARFHELSADQIARLATTSEGWITGARLAALSLRHGQELERIGANRGREQDRFLDDYVREEILAPLDPALQRFLRETADLTQWSAELCDATLERSDSEALLDALQRECPFLIPSGNAALPWRLMTMVGASLRHFASESEPRHEREARLRRAAEWLSAEGQLEGAADLALKAPDPVWMARRVEPWCRHLADRSDFERLEAWLNRLPKGVFAIDPLFAYWAMIVKLGVGRADGVREALAAVEPSWRQTGDPCFTGRANLCRGMLAYLEGADGEALEALDRALVELPAGALVERLYAATVAGRGANRLGDTPRALTRTHEAESYAARLPMDEQWAWRTIAPDRANSYALGGEIHSAITKYRMMLIELPPALEELEGFLRCRLIDLLIERNELEQAALELETIELLVGEAFRAWHHDAIIARARLLIATGQRDEADQWAASHVRAMRRRPGKNQLVLLLARIWLERGDYAMVRHWLSDISETEYPWIQTFGEINVRSLAIDLDLAQGRFAQAAEAADAIADEAATTGRWAEFITFSTRGAIAHRLAGHRQESTRRICAAFDAGVRGGFVRSFDVAGFDIAAMFGDILRPTKAYRKLWLALQQREEDGLDRGTSVLTKREIEVLRSVSKGRSNQQIADELFISSNTVRNHLVNICRRLQASSRSEAVAHARQLGILD